jgi:nucleoside-diphosphate-sugar epimerase
MTTAVIGATGRVGSEIVRGVLARGDTVAALVRDPDKASCSAADGLMLEKRRWRFFADILACISRTASRSSGRAGRISIVAPSVSSA